MNILLHLIILFVFVFALLMFNIPQIQNDQYIKQKLYIFFGIFIFEFLTNIFITVYRKCIVDLRKVVSNSLEAALVATLAYSIFNDLSWSESSIIPSTDNKIATNLVIAIMITAFLAVTYLLQSFLNKAAPSVNDCLNNIYQKK